MLVVNAPGIVSIFTKSRSDHGNSYEFKSTSHSASRNHTKSYINSDDPHYHAQIARNSIAIPGTDEAHHTTIISSNRPPLGSGIGFDGTESQERIISPRNSNSPHDHLQDIDIDLEDGMGMRRVGEKGDKMVIHQKVTYEVTAEQLSTTRRSSNSSEHSSGGSIDKSGRPASEMH